MTTTQSFKIYEILQRYFKSDADAKIVVSEIEHIIESKFDSEVKQLATKEDILAMRLDFEKIRVDIEKRFNAQIIWTVSTGMGIVGILLVIFKLK
jgi:hypothetical protein